MPRSSQSVFRQAIFLQTGDAMDVLWGIVVGFGHAIEQVLVYVESHHWIFGFAALAIFSTCMTEVCTPGSIRSTSGSTKSGNAWPSNIDGAG